MTSIQIFNVCTHSRDGGGGLSMGIPTPCVLSPHPTNAQRFVTGGGDSNAFIWHFSTIFECGLEQIAKLAYHTKQVNAVIWNSLGNQLVTSGDDKMIVVWKQDETYDYLSNKNKQPSFGESMIFKEKWLPLIKMRGPIAEVSDIKYINNNKHIIVSSLDGSIGFYHIKKQQHLHSISLHKNTQFIQGLAIDYTCNLLAIQTNSASAKVYKINKHKTDKKKKKNKKNKYTTSLFCSLSHYPYSIHELEQQKIYDQKYKDEKKEFETMEMEMDKVNNTNTNNNNNNKMEMETETEKPKPKMKIRKKRISKSALFKHNLPTTSRQCDWSADGLLLGMVAGQSKDKSHNCVHIFHRANLTKKITTILLPESSHATCIKFSPLKLKLDNEIGVDKASIVDKYNMKYKMLFAIICGSELFIFDTSKNNGIFYWKDEDTQNFHDMEWTFNGKALLVSDVEGFITRISLSDEDVPPI